MISLRVAGRRRRARRAPRGRRRPAPLDLARAAPCVALGQGRRSRRRPTRRRARAGLRAPREGQRPRRARGVRALPRRDRLRRPDRAPRARARAPGGREGADDRAPPPRRRARREPQPARVVDRQAEALVAAGHATRRETIDVLLARAAYARGGVNWRDAIPYYERVLALDPDNVPATLAKVELYEEAGLRDTALALLRAGARAAARGAWRSCARWSPRSATRAARPRPTRWPSATRRCASTTPRSPARASSSRSRGATRRRPRAGSIASSRRTPTAPARSQTSAQAWSRLGERARAIAAYRARARPRARGHRHDAPARERLLARRRSATSSCASSSASSSSCRRRRTCATTSRTSSRRRRARTSCTRARASEFLAKRAAPADGPGAPHARRPAGDHRLPERPREPLPPGRLPAAHRGRGRRRRASTTSRTRPTARPSSSARARVYRSRRARRRGHRERRGRQEDDPAVSMYTSARSYYVRFPRLEPGDVVELQYRVEDVAPRNEFADYFGEIAYMQSAEPIGASEYVLMTPKSAHVLLQRAARPGPRAHGRGAGDQRIYTFRAKNVPRDGAGGAAAAVDRGPRARARLDLQVVGRHGHVVLGPRARTSSSPTTRCAGAPRS